MRRGPRLTRISAVRATQWTMAADPSTERLAEAARYAVLRRIGPALKHDLVVNLQAVAMMAEILGARLDKGVLTQEELHGQISRIHRVVREAVTQSLAVAAWLAPQDEEGVALNEGIRECLDLVRSNFGFRGFGLEVELPDTGVEVSDDLLRHLLPAALIHLSDQAEHPGLLRISAQVQAGTAVIALTLEPAAGANEPEPLQPWRRPIAAADLRALADTADVPLEMAADRVVLRLPRLVPLTPLGIAPH